MTSFLTASLGYPTAVFTVLLGVALIYWFTVIIGVLDVDLFGGADAALDGGAEAAAEGVGEAIGEAGDAAVEGASSVTDAPSLLTKFRLRDAPATVVLTIYLIWNWIFCYFGSHYLAEAIGDEQRLMWGSALLVTSLLLSLPLTSAGAVMLAPIFRTHSAISRSSLIGKTVEISTGRVDRSFGQATCDDGGAGLLLAVRCDPEHGLTKGSRAIVLSYDESGDFYEVEPLDNLLSHRSDA